MDKDKKQLAILGALFAVMVGVGAFSFLGGSKPAAPVKKEGSEAAQVQEDNRNLTDQSEIDPTVGAMVGPEFPARDPFKPLSASAAQLAANSVPKPQPTKLAQPQPSPVAQHKPVPPAIPGAIQQSNSDTSQPMAQHVPPASPRRDPNVPPYRVIGTVTQGETPVAILEDDGGKQFFLKTGDSSGTVRLLSIHRRHVLVEYAGKEITLSMAD